MLKACPHCQAPLQPGEVYLGWCGECGQSLLRLPDSAASQPGETAPVPAAWRWVARGTLVKMTALLVAVGALVMVLADAGWDVGKAFKTPLPAGVGVLLAAAGLNILGRLLCLGTPQAAARWLVIVSVTCQLSAASLVLGAVLARPGGEETWTLGAGAVLAQIAAAVTYTIYLFAVGVYFRSPLVMTLAGLVKVAIAAAAAGVVAVAAVVALVVLVIFVVGFLLFFACPCLGVVVMGAGGKLGEAAIGPITIALAVVLGVVEVAYGTTLGAVWWELWQRRMFFR